MNSGERFNKLLGSLEAIKDIRVKTAIYMMLTVLLLIQVSR